MLTLMGLPPTEPICPANPPPSPCPGVKTMLTVPVPLSTGNVPVNVGGCAPVPETFMFPLPIGKSPLYVGDPPVKDCVKTMMPKHGFEIVITTVACSVSTVEVVVVGHSGVGVGAGGCVASTWGAGSGLVSWAVAAGILKLPNMCALDTASVVTAPITAINQNRLISD